MCKDVTYISKVNACGRLSAEAGIFFIHIHLLRDYDAHPAFCPVKGALFLSETSQLC